MELSKFQLIGEIKHRTTKSQLTAWEKVLINKKLKPTDNIHDIILIFKLNSQKKKTVDNCFISEIANNYSNQLTRFKNPLSWNAQILAYYLVNKSIFDFKMSEFAFYYDKLLVFPPIDDDNADDLIFKMIKSGITDAIDCMVL